MFNNQRRNFVQPDLTTVFVRKTFEVDAVQVTDWNIAVVAEWCRGTVYMPEEGDKVAMHVKVNVLKPLNERQTCAFVGDWILLSSTGFKVYTNRAFTNSFVQGYGTYDVVSEDQDAEKRPDYPTMTTEEVVRVYGSAKERLRNKHWGFPGGIPKGATTVDYEKVAHTEPVLSVEKKMVVDPNENEMAAYLRRMGVGLQLDPSMKPNTFVIHNVKPVKNDGIPDKEFDTTEVMTGEEYHELVTPNVGVDDPGASGSVERVMYQGQQLKEVGEMVTDQLEADKVHAATPTDYDDPEVQAAVARADADYPKIESELTPAEKMLDEIFSKIESE